MPPSETAPTMPSPPDERRKNQRAILIVQVECKGTQDYVLGQSQDISEGGLLVVTPQPLNSQTEVTVRLNLPPDPPGDFIESQGIVAHVRPGESMGIQFLQLTDRQREAIVKFVRQVLGGDE